MSEPKSKKAKPVYVAKVGNVRVPVLRYGDDRLVVIWRQFEGGPRKRETFTKRAKAEERADEIARAISNSQADVLSLTSADRDNYRLAVQALEPLGIPLHAAIEEYIAARKAIPGHTLMEAVNFFSRGYLERKACPTTAKILDELLVELADDRRENRKYVEPLKRDLEKFAIEFPSLQEVTEEDIRRYLGGLTLQRAARGREAGAPVSARRRDNVREAIVRIMRFARKKEYLPEDKTSPAERIRRLSEGGEVTTYAPEQLAEILNYFATKDRQWLPWAALAAFAGLRTSEIFRLDWSAIKWTQGVIAVSRAVARKVRVSRLVPIRLVEPVDEAEGRPARSAVEPLVAWLEDFRDATGPVIPREWKDLEAAHCDALDRLKRALKWDQWHNNALRHSFGSNRLAIVKSYAQVALEMGNSPAKVREHYNDPKPEIEALRYFAVLPPATVTNIVHLETAKAFGK